MNVAIRRAARGPIPHLSRRSTTRPTAGADEPTYREVYEMLSEAADLVARASRQLRYAQHADAGFALQPVADEIHEHIRRLPPSVSDRPAHRHHRFEGSGS